MSPRVALEAGTQPQIGQTHRLRDIRLMPIRPQLTRTERCPAMSSPGSHRPEPPEAGETDTDAELPASLKAKRHVPSTAPYERVRSNSIAAGLIHRNRPLSDIALWPQISASPSDRSTAGQRDAYNCVGWQRCGRRVMPGRCSGVFGTWHIEGHQLPAFYAERFQWHCDRAPEPVPEQM
jgi:hypothetical protein